MYRISRNSIIALVALALASGPLSACSGSDVGDDYEGGISVHGATIPVPASDVAAVYLTIENTGSEADQLTGASSGVAGRSGIHQTSVTDGTASMSSVDVIEIPANSSVVFAGGGYHLMLMDLREPVAAGDEVSVTLTFERAGDVEVVAAVVANGAMSGAGGTGPETAESIQGVAFSEYYQATCAACHGAQRQGVIGPALTGATLIQDDEFYVDTITNGRPGTAMPAWGSSGLTTAEVFGIVNWLKTDQPR